MSQQQPKTFNKSQTKQTQPQKQSRKSKRRARKRGAKPRRAVGIANMTDTKAITVTKTELWDTVVAPAATSSVPNNIYRRDFDTTQGPQWFKTISKLYEMYQLKWVRIEVKSGAATTTSGTYILSYNTNYAEKSANRDPNALKGQLGSKVASIWDDTSMRIPGDAFKGWNTNTQLRSDNAGWLFNLELLTSGLSVATSLQVSITYKLVLRNPQLPSE